jgi:plastocyanin
MRYARLLTILVLTATFAAACTSASPGWTYAPAPSSTPVPSSAASAGPGASANPNLVTISALGIKFEQTEVTAPAGVPFQVSFENKDAGTPHNVELRLGSATGATLFKGTVFNGIETRVYDVPALDPGAYGFVCTVHPTMIGTLTAQ